MFFPELNLMVETLTFQKLFNDLLNQQAYGVGASITIGTILLNLLVSFLLAMFIYFIYRKTYSGVMYNKNFSITLLMTALIVTGIMMTITGNLALSLGMVGALSIIRFRTAIKDPKDVTFLFWAVSIGIMNGVSYFQLSIVLTVLLGAMMYIMSKRMPALHLPYILMVKYSSIDDEKMEALLKNSCSRFRIRNTSLSDAEGEKTIEVRVKKGQESKLLHEIKALKGVKKVILFSHEGELAE